MAAMPVGVPRHPRCDLSDRARRRQARVGRLMEEIGVVVGGIEAAKDFATVVSKIA